MNGGNVKAIDRTELRAIDKQFKCDEWGRKSRFFCTKESIESLGLEYKEGRAIKIIVANGFKTMVYAQKLALIQAFFAYLGIAPKVYRIGSIGRGFTYYPYLEVEYIRNSPADLETIKNKILSICKKYTFVTPYEIDLDKPKNYIGNKYVDYHGFEIDMPKFKEWLFKEINEITHWGHKNDQNKRFSYQTDGELKGKRDTEYRIKQLGLDKIDFKNKTVLDIGCNLGVLSDYCAGSGAKVLGVDTRGLKELAQLYKIYKYPLLDTEFQKADLSKTDLRKFGKFDIVLDLAMVHVLGYPKSLPIITKELLIFEGHNLQDPQGTANHLKKIFKNVEYKGLTKDRGKRPIYWCRS